MPLTATADASIIDLFVGSTLHLYTTAPTDETDGVEVTGGGYLPQPTTLTPDPENENIARNSDAIIFPNMPDCTVVAIGIKNVAGDLIYYDSLTTPKIYAADGIATVPVNSLVVTVST